MNGESGEVRWPISHLYCFGECVADETCSMTGRCMRVDMRYIDVKSFKNGAMQSSRDHVALDSALSTLLH
jgi:hypothetical protein